MVNTFPSKIRTRIAPTPSGFIHAGNAFSFLLTWAVTRRSGGSILLRIDDLDSERKRPEYVKDIFESLEWLGIDWNEGPLNTEEFESAYSQTLRISEYNLLLARLIHSDSVFACTCSRTDLLNAAIYPGNCLSKNHPLTTKDVSWRIKNQPENRVHFTDALKGEMTFSSEEMGGAFVIRRKDSIPAYQVASLVDDLRHEINFIVRGEDLLPSTASQIYLANCSGETEFQKTIFLHHPLVSHFSGLKLSKSKGADALKTMRDTGVQPTQIWNWFLAQWGYRGPGISRADEIIDWLDVSHLKQAGAKLFPFSPK